MMNIKKIDHKQMSFIELLRGTKEIVIKREAGPQANILESKTKRSKNK